jgi:hypothetical protein
MWVTLGERWRNPGASRLEGWLFSGSSYDAAETVPSSSRALPHLRPLSIPAGRTSEAISRLLQLAPDTAVLLTVDSDGKPQTEEEIDSALVQRGDILKVLPGAKVTPLLHNRCPRGT